MRPGHCRPGGTRRRYAWPDAAATVAERRPLEKLHRLYIGLPYPHNKTITFIAQQPPKLSIGAAGENVSFAFTSRPNLTYDLQVCTDLASGVWTGVEPHTFIDGYGDVKNMSDPMADRPRAFYRLVEYQ